jgi:hypothetical protein
MRTRTLLAALCTAAATVGCQGAFAPPPPPLPPSFSPADVTAAKESIRTQFSQQDFIIEDVELIRETPQKLSGYVKLKKPRKLFPDIRVTKQCTAIMGMDRRYTINCQ